MIRAMPIVATDPAQPRGPPALLADGAAGRGPRADGHRRQRLRGRASSAERIFDQLIVRTVLPLIALVFGTAALGTELEDGTIVFLLTKPIRRFRIVLAKGVVAAGLTAALIVPATVLTGLVATSQQASLVSSTVAYAIAAAVGGTAYALGFLALSSFTSRALAIGLGYVLLWEGVLSGLFEGTQRLLRAAGHAGPGRDAAGGATTPARRSAESPPWWSWAPSSWARWRSPPGASRATSCAAATDRGDDRSAATDRRTPCRERAVAADSGLP